mmetsp:Transcript_11906/g.21176  ORF Transcript_11906/g.21176 Transcript_11906/m.21176 type:complete len:84 (-) Transcript_11906:166-417(-)
MRLHSGPSADIRLEILITDLHQKQAVYPQVCEQCFKHINKFSSMLRPMRRERFNWLLLTIVEMDHNMRKSGLLKPGKSRKAAD